MERSGTARGLPRFSRVFRDFLQRRPDAERVSQASSHWAHRWSEGRLSFTPGS
jgi:hypothetical protein